MSRVFRTAWILLLYASGYAQPLDFESVAAETLHYDATLQQLQLDSNISRAELGVVRSGYYPSLSVGLNTQYTKSLDEGSGFASVDNNVYSDITQYETSVSLILNQRLYDFGALNAQAEMAKKDEGIARRRLGESRLELLTKLLDIYEDALLLYTEKNHLGRVEPIERAIYRTQKRLQDAGEADRLAVAESAVALLETEERMQEVQNRFEQRLDELTFYTGKHYPPQSELTGFSVTNISPIAYEQSDTYARNRLEIEKKEEELSLLEARQYPQVNFYGKYSFYGSSKCSTWCSFAHLNKKNYVVGISVQFSLFEGFKYSNEREKIGFELQKLKHQEEQSRREYEQRVLEAKRAEERFAKQLLRSDAMLEEQRKRMEMTEVLAEKQQVQKITSFQEEIAFEQKRFEYQQLEIRREAKRKRLELIGRYGGVSENTWKEGS